MDHILENTGMYMHKENREKEEGGEVERERNSSFQTNPLSLSAECAFETEPQEYSKYWI